MEVNILNSEIESVCENVAVFKQAISAVKLFNFPSCFIDEIGSRFFLIQATQILKNFLKSNFLINWIGSQNFLFFQASYSSFEILNYSIWFPRPKWFAIIQFFKKAIWSMKIFTISLRFQDWIGLRILCDFLSKLFELWNLKCFISFLILQWFTEILCFFYKLYELWNIPNGFIGKNQFPKS